MKKIFLIIALVLFILVLFLSKFGFEIGNTRIGYQTDDIQTSNDYTYYDSPFAKKLNGTTVVILWASWCSPCIQEIPKIKNLSGKYPNVKFVSISIDKSEKDLKDAIKKNGITNDITLENRNYRKQILNVLEGRKENSLISSEVVPKTYIVKNGRVLYKEIGEIDEDKVLRYIN